VEPILINKEELEQSRLKDVNAEKDLKFVSAPAILSSVPPWSLAHEIGLKVGDKILEINGHKLRDIFDFEFHFKQSEELEIIIARDKEEIVIELEKDAEDELGAEFVTPLFNGVQECANDCPFCFVENQPLDKTRESLQYRDDDFRMSYLHGSYVTLTNLSYSDRRRIEALRPGPLYVSVHATDLEVRNKMLGRKKSISIIEELKWLAGLEIPVHTQIVLCPEMNDGIHLLNTLNDLLALRNKPVVSVAIVPVGLTKYHRRGLRRFTLDETFDVINLVETWESLELKKRKSFAFLSDEFYLMTHTSIPAKTHYGNYPQLEDGVGMTRLFLNEMEKELKRKHKASSNRKHRVSWVNGTISKNIVEEVAKKIKDQFPHIELIPWAIESKFWGTTNVSGLLTGDDIYQGLRYIPKEMLGEKIIIPKVMLKDGYDIFLDDMHISELEEKLGIPCVKAWGAKELLQELLAS
jgi:putative radical SAM enzyme (TIGR03279 family)